MFATVLITSALLWAFFIFVPIMYENLQGSVLILYCYVYLFLLILNNNRTARATQTTTVRTLFKSYSSSTPTVYTYGVVNNFKSCDYAFVHDLIILKILKKVKTLFLWLSFRALP